MLELVTTAASFLAAAVLILFAIAVAVTMAAIVAVAILAIVVAVLERRAARDDHEQEWL